MKATYPLAADGVFDTAQGEGVLLGEPMTFVRLAGCSVGCVGCDTDYRVSRRLGLAELVDAVLCLPARRYVWLTGGEPTDHDIAPLVGALRAEGRLVAVATSGVRPCPDVDFVSVSPHSTPDALRVCAGDQLNLVPLLGGLALSDWESYGGDGFAHKWATPLWGGDVTACLAFVGRHPGWRLGVQAHKSWGVA